MDLRLMGFRSKRERISATLAESRRRRTLRPGMDYLETRDLLATVAVNAGTIVRPVDSQLLGVNVSAWDHTMNSPKT